MIPANVKPFILDRPQVNWKAIVSIAILGKYAFESYIDSRQLQVLKNSDIPPSLKSEISQDVFVSSQNYSSAKIEFSLVKSTVNVLKDLAFVSLDILPKLWSCAGRFSVHLGQLPLIGRFFGASVLSQSMTMFAITSTISILEGLPFSYYSSFVLEKKFGFNKSTVKHWMSDSLKLLLVRLTLGSPIVYGFVRIMDHFGSSFMIYMCTFAFLAQITAFTVIPNVVYPLFYKFNKLEEGELKDKIDDLARRNGFPVGKVWVINSSSRSTHSNAFFSGMPWSKKIVLFDTLIKQNTPDQIVAVLAHEIGHWKMNHTLQLMLTNVVFSTLTLLLFSAFFQNKSFLHSFGFLDEHPAFISYYLFSYIEALCSCATRFLRNLSSRKNEYLADDFAKAQGYSEELSKALLTLSTGNLKCPNADWLYSAYNHNHPILADRLNALGYVSNERIGKLKLSTEEKED